jgi:sigma-E factor negative regulatory protein RseB
MNRTATLARQAKWLATGLLTLQAALPAHAAPSAQAATPLSHDDASVFLQRMSDAARQMAYEGVFVVQQGSSIQTLSISNRPIGTAKDSRLAAMDGVQREVHCSRSGSISLITEGGQIKQEKRLNSRHFPDLLPSEANGLANFYTVKLGESARVAGLECQQIELQPKDAFRWGYVLCADKTSGLPLKAVMINENNQPLMQYAFAEIQIGNLPKNRPAARVTQTEPPSIPTNTRPIQIETVNIKHLPPGFSRISAVKRTLPNKPGEVEHWVFSDGLTHISLFLEPANPPIKSLRGQSKQGMINLAKRQVGPLQATVLGDAPWPAIEAITIGLEARTQTAHALGDKP